MASPKYSSANAEIMKNKTGTTIPFLLHDFQSAILNGGYLPKRHVTLRKDPLIECAISVDFSGDWIKATIRYICKKLPPSAYEVNCVFADVSENKEAQNYCHQKDYSNLWLTVTADWRVLCHFNCIVRKKRLIKYIETGVKFLLFFRFYESKEMDVHPTLTVLTSMFEEGTLADFTIEADGEEFHVHRAVLAASSDFFKVMFLSQMTEQQENKMVITDIEPDVVKEMLRFLYTSTIQDPEMYAEKLYIAADKYRLDKLRFYCTTELSRSIRDCDVINILILADTYNDSNLKKSTLAFIKKNVEQVMGFEQNVDALTSHPHLAVEILLNISRPTGTVDVPMLESLNNHS